MLKDESTENGIMLKDAYESQSAKEEENITSPNDKPIKNEIVLTGDADNIIEKKNINATIPAETRTETMPIANACQETENVDSINDVSNEITANKLEIAPIMNDSIEKGSISQEEKQSAIGIQMSEEKSDNLNEMKPVEQTANAEIGKLKKSKMEERPKSATEKIKLEFKPKAEEKLKSETLTEKAKVKMEAKEKMEAKQKVEEIPKVAVDKKIESKPNKAEDLKDNKASSVTEKSKEKVEPKHGAEVKFATEKPKEKKSVEEKQTSTTEKKVKVKSKESETSKDKIEGKTKNETSKSGTEKSKEKLDAKEKSKEKLDAKPIAEERPKSVTDVTKEKEVKKSSLRKNIKLKGKSKTVEKTEPLSSASSKSSAEESKKPSPKEASGANSPVSNPDSPNMPFSDAEKDPDKCVIS